MNYCGADKSLARPTSRCILFDGENISFDASLVIYINWSLHLIVVRRFEYASDPESYTSGSVATGRVSLAGQVKG